MPRHFAEYKRRDPEGYQTFSDNMWNGFVSITKHIPIVGRFFSFTPDFLTANSDPRFFDAMSAQTPEKAGDK